MLNSYFFQSSIVLDLMFLIINNIIYTYSSFKAVDCTKSFMDLKLMGKEEIADIDIFTELLQSHHSCLNGKQNKH